MATFLKTVVLVLTLSLGWISPSEARKTPPLRVPLAASQINLDPSQIQDQSSLWVSRHLNCQLIRYERSQVVLDAAEKIEFQGEKIIRFRLKSGLRFNNGSEIKSADVKASFELLRTKRHIHRNIFQWVKKIELHNDQELSFELNAPTPQFLKVLAAPTYALFSSDFIRRTSNHPELWRDPVGCGQYRIQQSHSKANELLLAPMIEGQRPILFSLLGRNEISPTELKNFDLVGIPVQGTSPDLKLFEQVNLFDPYQIFIALNSQLPRWSQVKNRCDFLKSLNKAQLLSHYPAGTEQAQDLIPRGVIGYRPRTPSTPTPFYANYSEICVEALGVSVPQSLLPAYSELLSGAAQTIETRILKDPVNMGSQFRKSKCDAFVFGLKSNYLDGFEYLQLFTDPNANPTGYTHLELSNSIKKSQDISDPAQRAEQYQKISDQINQACLLEPLVLSPFKRVFIRKGIVARELGIGPLNSYYLGAVQ